MSCQKSPKSALGAGVKAESYSEFLMTDIKNCNRTERPEGGPVRLVGDPAAPETLLAE